MAISAERKSSSFPMPLIPALQYHLRRTYKNIGLMYSEFVNVEVFTAIYSRASLKYGWDWREWRVEEFLTWINFFVCLFCHDALKLC